MNFYKLGVILYILLIKVLIRQEERVPMFE